MIRRVVLLLAAALVLGGCSGGGDDEPSSEPSAAPTSGPERYVALGDSFTAAPGVPPQVGGPCGRSGSNYPSVVAEAEGLKLTDVSCSAATSQDLLDLQLRAVTADTSLVTVSIGGNDDGLFGRLVGSCAFGECVRGSLVTTALRKIRRNVGDVLDAVAAAAPDGTIPFHPFAVGEAGMAAVVQELLEG